jgi:hypothetical protein
MTWTKEGWDKKLQEVPPRKIAPEDWPVGIRPVTLDEEGLGVDKNGALYWHLKPVAMRIKLRWFELALAVIATTATVVQAIAAVVTLMRVP